MCMQYTAASGKSAARWVGCKPGTWASSRVQLLAGFGVSALAHVPGDMMVGQAPAQASAPFLLLQVLAITFEDFVIDIGKHCGVREAPWVHIVGWLWTFGWFSFSTPYFIAWAFAAGAARNELFAFSAVRPALDLASVVTGGRHSQERYTLRVNPTLAAMPGVKLE